MDEYEQLMTAKEIVRLRQAYEMLVEQRIRIGHDLEVVRDKLAALGVEP